MNNRIRDLREDADFTQAQIASYLNMSQTGYSKYDSCLEGTGGFLSSQC